MVWRNLHGQHADGVPQPTLRLFAFLFEKRCAAGDLYGDDLHVCGPVLVPAGDRRRTMYRVPLDRPMAAEGHVRRRLTAFAAFVIRCRASIKYDAFLNRLAFFGFFARGDGTVLEIVLA
ncbi:hypothetical protein MPLSOD_160143 [Mesorhizobium sp. SOD10]|nr:hypothetical protein MPLSOD_160143 [Mesorhizobium sp. SOD10]